MVDHAAKSLIVHIVVVERGDERYAHALDFLLYHSSKSFVF